MYKLLMLLYLKDKIIMDTSRMIINKTRNGDILPH